MAAPPATPKVTHAEIMQRWGFQGLRVASWEQASYTLNTGAPRPQMISPHALRARAAATPAVYRYVIPASPKVPEVTDDEASDLEQDAPVDSVDAIMAAATGAAPELEGILKNASVPPPPSHDVAPSQTEPKPRKKVKSSVWSSWSKPSSRSKPKPKPAPSVTSEPVIDVAAAAEPVDVVIDVAPVDTAEPPTAPPPAEVNADNIDDLLASMSAAPAPTEPPSGPQPVEDEKIDLEPAQTDTPPPSDPVETEPTTDVAESQPVDDSAVEAPAVEPIDDTLDSTHVPIEAPVAEAVAEETTAPDKSPEASAAASDPLPGSMDDFLKDILSTPGDASLLPPIDVNLAAQSADVAPAEASPTISDSASIMTSTTSEDKHVSFAPGTPEPKPTKRKKRSKDNKVKRRPSITKIDLAAKGDDESAPVEQAGSTEVAESVPEADVVVETVAVEPAAKSSVCKDVVVVDVKAEQPATKDTAASSSAKKHAITRSRPSSKSTGLLAAGALLGLGMKSKSSKDKKKEKKSKEKSEGDEQKAEETAIGLGIETVPEVLEEEAPAKEVPEPSTDTVVLAEDPPEAPQSDAVHVEAEATPSAEDTSIILDDSAIDDVPLSISAGDEAALAEKSEVSQVEEAAAGSPAAAEEVGDALPDNNDQTAVDAIAESEAPVVKDAMPESEPSANEEPVKIVENAETINDADPVDANSAGPADDPTELTDDAHVKGEDEATAPDQAAQPESNPSQQEDETAPPEEAAAETEIIAEASNDKPASDSQPALGPDFAEIQQQEAPTADAAQALPEVDTPSPVDSAAVIEEKTIDIEESANLAAEEADVVLTSDSKTDEAEISVSQAEQDADEAHSNETVELSMPDQQPAPLEEHNDDHILAADMAATPHNEQSEHGATVPAGEAAASVEQESLESLATAEQPPGDRAQTVSDVVDSAALDELVTTGDTDLQLQEDVAHSEPTANHEDPPAAPPAEQQPIEDIVDTPLAAVMDQAVSEASVAEAATTTDIAPTETAPAEEPVALADEPQTVIDDVLIASEVPVEAIVQEITPEQVKAAIEDDVPLQDVVEPEATIATEVIVPAVVAAELAYPVSPTQSKSEGRRRSDRTDQPRSSRKHISDVEYKDRFADDRSMRSHREHRSTRDDVERRRRREARKANETRDTTRTETRPRPDEDEERRLRHEARRALRRAQEAEEAAKKAREEADMIARQDEEARRRRRERRADQALVEPKTSPRTDPGRDRPQTSSRTDKSRRERDEDRPERRSRREGETDTKRDDRPARTRRASGRIEQRPVLESKSQGLLGLFRR